MIDGGAPTHVMHPGAMRRMVSYHHQVYCQGGVAAYGLGAAMESIILATHQPIDRSTSLTNRSS
jgi:hypothetical protein